jgi:hypothetical protein
MENKIQFYEILVPTISNEGKPYRLKYHRVWDNIVREISGGLTIIAPIKGQWVSTNGEVFKERMIPVRLACSKEQIEEIADITAKYYNQKAIIYYLISDEVTIKNYED